MKIYLWFVALYQGAGVFFGLVKDVLTQGHGKVFNKKQRKVPACIQDPALGNHGFLHLEDARIHYVAKGPEDKPLMLFVHGFPQFWFAWHRQMTEFSKDYRCVAIDLRGNGESDKPEGIENYQIKYIMKDIQQVIKALGYKSCVLVAHDLGGLIAWAFARSYPDFVDKLIVINAPPASVFKNVMSSDKKQFKMSWYMFFYQLPNLPETKIGAKDFEFICETFNQFMINPLPAEELDAYVYRVAQPDAITPIINLFRAIFRFPGEPYDLDYTMPALLIWGMEDKVFSNQIPDVTEKEAPAIVVKRIKNCGHFAQCDAPERVNETMREWLSSHIEQTVEQDVTDSFMTKTRLSHSTY